MNYLHKSQPTVSTHNFQSENPLTPARLNSEQTASLLGFQVHDIPVLVAEKLLKPLGKPAHNSVKYFATVEILSFGVDIEWLRKATQKIYDYWKTKNARKEKTAPLPTVLTTEASLAA